MKIPFNMRIPAALAISAAVVFKLSTTPMVGTSREHFVPLPGATFFSTQSLRSTALYRVGMEGDFSKLLIARKAIASQTTDLLCRKLLPLSSNGHGGSTEENVRLAADTINMTIVHPNQIFSFNEIVGIRSEEKGYKPGPMYASGEKIIGVGGGICVVSTMLYNAALESGLKIIERHPHSGPVTYADPGRDAAVSFGLADLAFKNNSGSPILVRARVEDDALVVELYGKKKPGRTVELVAKDYEEIPYKIFEKEDESVPEAQLVVKQKARPGFSVTIVRLIKQNGKLVSREVMNHDVTLPANKIILTPVKPKDLVGSPSQPVAAPKLSIDVPSVHPIPSTADSVEVPKKPEHQSLP